MLTRLFPTLLLFSIAYGQAQIKEPSEEHIQSLIKDFVSDDISAVLEAQDSLAFLGEYAIPHLIKILDNPKAFVKLKKPGDALYPGNIKLYGHGDSTGHEYFIGDGYDIDWVALRAGWMLENLSWQKFGFDIIITSEKELLAFHEDNYEAYIENSKSDPNFKRRKFKKLNKVIEKAKKWWKENKNHWDYLYQLKYGLYHRKKLFQFTSLFVLENPDVDSYDYRFFRKHGLDEKWFEKEAKNQVIKLSKSRNKLNRELAQDVLRRWKVTVPD